MEIILQKEEKVVLEHVKILAVRDFFEKKMIVAQIENLHRPVILWEGDEEYESAGNWTNHTALLRAIDVLSRPEVPWGF
jgi:hypothetical protein